MRQFHPFIQREAQWLRTALENVRIIIPGLECELRSAREQLEACEAKRSRTLAAAQATGEARGILACAEDCYQKAVDARYALSSLVTYAKVHARPSRKEQLTPCQAPVTGSVQPIDAGTIAGEAT
jgi:hypothetical protein